MREVAELLELTPYLERKPGQLSGGQRQRVAMGRAIVRRPRVFLMDEPLSNLDAKLRVQMRADIAALQARLGVTTVYVTHDQAEAMTLGHRVAVLRDARLQQCATPRELFDRPVNTFVAGFIGSPAMNLCTLPVGEGRVAFGDVTIDAVNGRRPRGVGVRPEALELADAGSTRSSTRSRSSGSTRSCSARRTCRTARGGSSPGSTRDTRRRAASASTCARAPTTRRTSSTPAAASAL